MVKFFLLDGTEMDEDPGIVASMVAAGQGTFEKPKPAPRKQQSQSQQSKKGGDGK